PLRLPQPAPTLLLTREPERPRLQRQLPLVRQSYGFAPLSCCLPPLSTWDVANPFIPTRRLSTPSPASANETNSGELSEIARIPVAAHALQATIINVEGMQQRPCHVSLPRSSFPILRLRKRPQTCCVSIRPICSLITPSASTCSRLSRAVNKNSASTLN